MDVSVLQVAVATVPAGAWAVGVSGGADSVALLRLLAARSDLSLHIVHLDHETRDGESAIDAKFVADLARNLNIKATIRLRSDVERRVTRISKNTSARFRMARIALFSQVLAEESLQGVILAHHADDQAETIFQRLIRGSGPQGLAGMSARSSIGDLIILRPLLKINSRDLREFLKRIDQNWREDSSNASPKYLRNQLRMILVEDENLRASLLKLGDACRHYKKWTNTAAPVLDERFDVEALASLPPPIARRAASHWLKDRGSPPEKSGTSVSDRLIQMAKDAASPAQQQFPGRLLVRRRRGIIFVDPKGASPP